jgi:lipid A 3-O-deacylase
MSRLIDVTLQSRLGFVFALVAMLMTAAPAHAEDALSFLPDKGDANLTFYLDNDLFASEDENYTNGVRLSWISGSRDPEEFGWLQRQLQDLTGDDQSRKLFRRLSGFEDPEHLEYNYGFSLTQLMFTPEDLDALSAPPGERPYAAWLGVDISLHAKDSKALNTVSLALGTTGPNALGEETQDLVHGLRGLKKFAGWDSQIPGEMTVNLYWAQRRRLEFIEPNGKKFSVDGFVEWRLAAGNFFTGANVGGLVRFGWNLPVSFPDSRLSVTAYSHQPFKTERENVSGWSFYGITGALVAGVVHDITIDGPVFRDFDTGIESEAVVGQLYAGFGVAYGNWNVSYVHTFRSKEFKGQDEAPNFGSLTVGYRI